MKYQNGTLTDTGILSCQIRWYLLLATDTVVPTPSYVLAR